MQHKQSITKSFGANAGRYLTSPVHSTGADLDFLARLVARLDQPRVLDLGCGAGHASFATAPFAREVVAFDLTRAMLEVTGAAAKGRGLTNISTMQGSVEELPFPVAEFDCVVSRYSAHHWNDVPRALREVKRILKPGGWVCMIDLAGAPSPLLDTHLQAVELARDPSHVRSYTNAEWLSFFEAALFYARLEQKWRLATEFSSWVSRIGTSGEGIAAIRHLWSGAPSEVRDYFNLQDDLSFEVDVAMILASG
ncbi:MAG TPA: class I SAM-dependent methyltransferase [Acidobacteriaceae bacterium]|nr:class I SAM-dependent methyltransferase [Acidobacteriaceae bacterium]